MVRVLRERPVRVQRPDNATTVPLEGVTADNTALASVVDDGETTLGNVAQDFFSLRQSTITSKPARPSTPRSSTSASRSS